MPSEATASRFCSHSRAHERGRTIHGAPWHGSSSTEVSRSHPTVRSSEQSRDIAARDAALCSNSAQLPAIQHFTNSIRRTAHAFPGRPIPWRVRRHLPMGRTAHYTAPPLRARIARNTMLGQPHREAANRSSGSPSPARRSSMCSNRSNRRPGMRTSIRGVRGSERSASGRSIGSCFPCRSHR